MMCFAQRWCAALLLAVSAACVGCDQSSADATPKPAPTPTEPPAPQARPTEPPAKPLVEVTPRAAKSVREVIESQRISGTWALRLEASWPKGICSPQHK